jgi:methionine-S-sulfoxide reductase
VVRTRVGYAGGTKPDPTYSALGDHSETIQLDFDPSRISYAELLKVFWENHQPLSQYVPRQYMSIIFYHNEEQRLIAEKSKADREQALGVTLYTEIIPYQEFNLAEDYHQKYYLQNSLIINEYLQIYPGMGQLINSTAVARANGYLGGNGTADVLETEIDQLGLSERGMELLRAAIER